ncbi:hypothetical protein FB107DRAFT_280349 [Schizophyllum commune]
MSAPAELLSHDPPSPLLCSRRTFLATKFTLDRCYSSRARATISSLQSREIGRCDGAEAASAAAAPATPKVSLASTCSSRVAIEHVSRRVAYSTWSSSLQDKKSEIDVKCAEVRAGAPR